MGDTKVPLEHRICPCPPAQKSVLVSGMHGRFHRRSLERALRSLPAEEEEAEIDGEGSEELQAVLRECQSKRRHELAEQFFKGWGC